MLSTNVTKRIGFKYIFLPTITASLAFKSNKHSIASRYKVMLLHWPTKSITEGLNNAGIIRSWGVVQSQGLSAVPSPRLYWRLNTVDTKTVNKLKRLFNK